MKQLGMPKAVRGIITGPWNPSAYDLQADRELLHVLLLGTRVALSPAVKRIREVARSARAMKGINLKKNSCGVLCRQTGKRWRCCS